MIIMSLVYKNAISDGCSTMLLKWDGWDGLGLDHLTVLIISELVS